MNRIEIKDGYAHFECGCKFLVKEMGPPVRLVVKADTANLPKDCKRTWDLVGEGNTKGIFQLESSFGQQYAKKLKPENMEQLAALSAILRPGCKNAIRDGMSVSDHYIRRKNGLEEVEFFHPDLEKILGSTFGEMIYQEQAMQIAQHFAGFDLKQADVLRKAIGKKKADIMASLKNDFLEGCRNVGLLSDEQSEELFSWIEKSQKYSFNKSHAVSYAESGYTTAYLKAHFPMSFFTSYLYYAKDKKPKPFDEVKLLVTNAKLMDISIYPPDFRNEFSHFKRVTSSIDKVYNPWNDKIYFGFGDIREVGESAILKIKKALYPIELALEKPRSEWTWMDFLVFFSQEEGISSTTINALIEAGALDYFRVSRTRMMFEYKHYSTLTKKEQAWIRQNLYNNYTKSFNNGIDDLNKLLSATITAHEGGNKCFANKNRVVKAKGVLKLVANPPSSLEDTPDWIARVEESRLGTAITSSIIAGCKGADQANCTIIEFMKHKEKSSGIFIACQVESIKTHTTVNGDEMAFITLTDGEVSLDGVCFSDSWQDIKASNLAFEGNMVMISGDRSNRDDGGLILKKMWQLS